MAIIGKIREKSWLLVIIVGLALVAFILGDYLTGSRGLDDSVYGYGTVFGDKIDPQLYETASTNFQNMDKNQFAQQQKEYTPKDMEASNAKAFKAIADSIILQSEFDKLGISVSDREFDAYLYGDEGFDVLPDIAQSFQDPQTGLFNRKLLEKRVEEMKSSSKPEDQKGWENTKSSLSMRRQQDKYFALLKEGVYITKLEAKDNFNATNVTKSISFVMGRLSDIKDESIKVTDEEVKKYYEAHKEDKKYAIRKPGREVKYFDVMVAPSKKDSIRFNKSMDSLKAKFSQVKGNVADSLFVIKNSEQKFFSPKIGYRKEGDKAQSAQQGFTYPVLMDTVFGRAGVGTIVGPYFDKGSYKLSKVIAVENQLLSVRHILIQGAKSDTVAAAKAKKTADSLMAFVNTTNFAEYVTKFSQDPGSKESGGKYEDFIAGDMVDEFSNFAKTNPVGKIGYVQTTYGYHIIEVLGKKPGHVPILAVVSKTLAPSLETLENIESDAYELYDKIEAKVSKAADLKAKMNAFDTLASRANYFPRLLSLEDNNLNVYGINTPLGEDKILELAYDENNTPGTLALPIKDGARYLIAMLGVVKEKGVPSFEAVELIMKQDLINEKKKKKLVSRMVGKNLNDLSKAMNIEIMKADITFGSPQIANGGWEPEVIGKIFGGLKDGKRSLPIEGQAAVYVVRVDKTTKAAAALAYDKEKASLKQAAVQNIQGEALNALREKAEVIDNRRLFTLGVRR